MFIHFVYTTPVLGIYNISTFRWLYNTENICAQISMWTYVFIFLGKYTQVEFLFWVVYV